MSDRLHFDLAIIGSGRVARAVGGNLAKSGWRIIFGSRDRVAARERIQAVVDDPNVVDVADAVRQANVILLAVPWRAAQATCSMVPDWKGKTLIECSNPLNATFSGLELGFDSSAAETVAQWASGADVVKTLNTASSDLMASPTINGIASNMFYCGGNETSKVIVAKLLTDLGFDPLYCGPLQSARYLEPYAMMLIDMAVRHGYRGKWSMQMLREVTR